MAGRRGGEMTVERRRGPAWLTWQRALPGLAVLIGIVLIATPFLATVVRSVLAGPESALTFSGRNFVALFQDQRFYRALTNTLIAGSGATLVSCVFGLGLAWIVARSDLP